MTEHAVLFIDDEPNILKAIQRLLRHEPMRVLTATDPNEALEIMRKTPTQVVVTDQRMPTMSGVDFLSKVREQHSDVIRMMLTGYTEMNIAVEAIGVAERADADCDGARGLAPCACRLLVVIFLLTLVLILVFTLTLFLAL